MLDRPFPWARIVCHLNSCLVGVIVAALWEHRYDAARLQTLQAASVSPYSLGKFFPP
ncbi:hypothetical protein M406DRAFT_320830 [Cryphonectria parasitica EP155]|uniref:Uncharacterized protein n=1 Tax=Cryphonectria parasitica (strain ATCC 38755 / EP155) TaxID=660469 RepID=A0A9P5CSF2_CRYP1|nr:uncharacterized protein M406DRAFT_320830 [Cryphonectria parasitica EP155]KAF3768261.1 hypothetical protein M406DRAFT_320830 [Cryphonectria parasitica EP155]